MKNGSPVAGQRWFANLLLKWNREENSRSMPWKGERDPYRVWLSEIILQQTRVEQGTRYYSNFIQEFPTVRHLARANEEKVFKLWEGLGYYSRCRNLISTARQITEEMGGKFPDDIEGLKSLRGVGPYTAAAIGSFAFNLPYAVVDGNVYRVLARVWGITEPVDSTEGKKFFGRLAQDLLDPSRPGQYNQAIMDFGATVCKPVSPLCGNCIFSSRCISRRSGTTANLPVKQKKKQVRQRWFYYTILEFRNELFIRQRKEKDIWQDLFEFPMIEGGADWPAARIVREAEEKGIMRGKDHEIVGESPYYRQQLTHQLISARFLRTRIKGRKPAGIEGEWMSKASIRKLAFPRIVSRYLQDQDLTTPAAHVK